MRTRPQCIVCKRHNSQPQLRYLSSEMYLCITPPAFIGLPFSALLYLYANRRGYVHIKSVNNFFDLPFSILSQGRRRFV
ncbi:hypothetical protein ANTPLA_LOCUS4528 [Anthophora plagiata]